MDNAVQEAFEACYEDVAGGLPMPPEVERAMLFWLDKHSPRYSVMLFGIPGFVVRGAVIDGRTMLVIRSGGERVPLHLFLFATALPLLAIFKAGPCDDA